MDKGFDLTTLIMNLAQAVPVWTFLWLAFTHYLKRSKETADKLEVRLASIEEAVQEIKLSIADAGVRNLKENLDELKEAKVRADMKIEAAFRHIDEMKNQRAR